MDLSPAVIAAVATLFAAGTAATVSLVVSVLSKEQKTSEFRQEWIDGLRTDVAEWLGEVAMLYRLTTTLTPGDTAANKEAIQLRFANLVKVRTLSVRIELRLNPDEHTEMLKALRDLRDTAPSAERSVLNPRIAAVSKECKAILKAEWERVKKGEPAFVQTKLYATRLIRVALIAVVALLVLAIVSQTGVLSMVRSVSMQSPAPSSGERGPGATGGSAGLLFSPMPDVPATSTTAGGGKPAGTGKFESTPTGDGGR